MQTTPLLTLKRGMCDHMYHAATTVDLRPDGFYQLGVTVLLEELTPQQREEYEADMAAPQPPDEDSEPPPKFSTIEDAIEYGEAMRAVEDTYEDLQGFHAPSECYRDAMPPVERRLMAALEKAVR